MSEKLPDLVKNTDITESEMAKINKFIEDGLPGIGTVNETQLYRMYELYLTGSTYSQIAVTLGLKKIIVLYLSHNNDWYSSKKEYLSEIQEKIKNRVVESKLRSQEFMLLLVQAWQKKISKNLNKFLATNDEEHMERVDLKEVAQLMKAIEIVNDLDNTGKDSKGKTPAVGINVGNGVTIEKSGNNKISITPAKTSIGEILKQYADASREEEKNKLVNVNSNNDIDNK